MTTCQLLDISPNSEIEISKDKIPKIKKEDLDLKFISTVSGLEKGNPRKPERGLVRHQFIEVLVRIAEELLIKPQIFLNFKDAIQYMWENNLKAEFQKYDF